MVADFAVVVAAAGRDFWRPAAEQVRNQQNNSDQLKSISRFRVLAYSFHQGTNPVRSYDIAEVCDLNDVLPC